MLKVSQNPPNRREAISHVIQIALKDIFNFDPISGGSRFFGADLDLNGTPREPTREQRGGRCKQSTGKVFVATHGAADHHGKGYLAVVRSPCESASECCDTSGD